MKLAISWTVEWLLPFINELIFMLGLDVLRTDRTLVFYEKQENLSKLWDILAVYAWVDKDVGYCQGGSMVNILMLLFRK